MVQGTDGSPHNGGKYEQSWTIAISRAEASMAHLDWLWNLQDTKTAWGGCHSVSK